jgi:hypothetical protein
MRVPIRVALIAAILAAVLLTDVRVSIRTAVYPGQSSAVGVRLVTAIELDQIEIAFVSPVVASVLEYE